MNPRLQINPKEPQGEESRLLYSLLSSQKGEKFLSKDKIYWVGITCFKITNDIIIREKSMGNYRFDVVDTDSFASGKFGNLYKVIATLKVDEGNEELVIKQGRIKNVVKLQNLNAETEYKLMLRCPHLSSSRLFPGIPSKIEMPYLPGLLLNDVINRDRNGDKALTISERFELSLLLLKSLLTQIHDYGVCHRDIKPDNIIYDEDNKSVYFFDFGISKRVVNTRDMRSRGNSTFSAPEEFTSQKSNKPVTYPELLAMAPMKSSTTLASDVFSIARVIGLVWRDCDQIFLSRQGGFRQRLQERAKGKWQVTPTMFVGLGGLPEVYKEQILQLLMSMSSRDPMHRPELHSCILKLEMIYLRYKLDYVYHANPEEILSAHNAAIRAFHDLRFIVQADRVYREINTIANDINANYRQSLASFKKSLSRRFYTKYSLLLNDIESITQSHEFDDGKPLGSFVSLLNKVGDINFLKDYLINSISVLPDNNMEAVLEYISVLGIKAFEGAASKNALIDIVNDIVDKYRKNYNKLLQVVSDMGFESDNPKISSRYNHDYKSFMKRLNNYPLSIDAVSIFANKMKRRRKKYQSQALNDDALVVQDGMKMEL